MPRPYRMGKRALGVADTRRRIVDAAIDLYQERGISGTTFPAVARRADVAAGTVANHFASAEALAAAVAERLRTKLTVPAPAIFEGLETVAERIRALTIALAAFYERSEPWYRVHAREAGRVLAWEAAERDFHRAVDELARTALGAAFDDRRVRVVVGQLIDPGTLTGLRRRGLASEEAGKLIGDVLVAWLDRHQNGAVQ